MTDPSLPYGFESLEPFVVVWSADSAAGRDRLRGENPPEDRAAFFSAAHDLLVPALTLLDAKPLALLEPCERRLLSLMLSFAHVSLAEEIQRDHEPKHADQRRFLAITTAPSDRDFS
jgi:hypothetical protein